MCLAPYSVPLPPLFFHTLLSCHILFVPMSATRGRCDVEGAVLGAEILILHGEYQKSHELLGPSSSSRPPHFENTRLNKKKPHHIRLSSYQVSVVPYFCTTKVRRDTEMLSDMHTLRVLAGTGPHQLCGYRLVTIPF